MGFLPIPHLAIAAALVAGTVAIHSAGSFVLIVLFNRHRVRSSGRPGYTRLIFVLTFVVFALLFLHMLEVALWAAFYSLEGSIPDVRTSVYFSLVTYATVGYGDVVLSEEWRVLAGIEALVGVMMMSWSTALLIACVQWVYSRLLNQWEGEPPRNGPIQK